MTTFLPYFVHFPIFKCFLGRAPYHISLLKDRGVSYKYKLHFNLSGQLEWITQKLLKTVIVCK